MTTNVYYYFKFCEISRAAPDLLLFLSSVVFGEEVFIYLFLLCLVWERMNHHIPLLSTEKTRSASISYSMSGLSLSACCPLLLPPPLPPPTRSIKSFPINHFPFLAEMAPREQLIFSGQNCHQWLKVLTRIVLCGQVFGNLKTARRCVGIF
jgi:hypothetical protein